MKFKKWSKIIIFTLAIIFFGSFLTYKISLPSALDLPRQIQNGRDILHGNFRVLTDNVYSYTEPYQPFANHHWLFGVFSYLLYIGVGFIGMSVFKILFMIVTFLLLLWLAFKRSDFFTVAIFSIPTILILIGRSAFRPEIFSYFFLVIFLILLFDLEKNPEKKRIYWLIPLELIWVNTHIFFPIGIMLVAGFLFEKIILNFKKWRTDKIIRKLFYVVLGSTSMIFINPFGLMGVVYSLTVNTAKEFPVHSMEVTTAFKALMDGPGWTNISILVFLPTVIFLFVSFIFAFFVRHKLNRPLYENNFIFLFLASVGSAGLSYFIFRALPLFGSIFLVSICSLSKELFFYPKKWFSRQEPILKNVISYILIILLIIIYIYFIYIGEKKVNRYQEQGFGLTKYALSSAEFFKQQDLKGPIFNDTDSGSYLIGELYPQEMVFADNRFGDSYSAAFFKDVYIPLIQDEVKWKEGMKRFNFNVIFMNQYDQGDGVKDFIYRRIYDSDWAWVYADKYNVILVRNVLKNKDVIDKYMITYQNAPEKLKYLINSIDISDKMNAADLMNLIGRVDISIPLYLQYLSQRPESGEIWFVLGRTELLKADQSNSNPSLAIIYLENAIKYGWTRWETYSYLALAYRRTNQLERMKESIHKELQMVPDSEDAKRWVKILAEDEEKLKNNSR